MKPYLLLISLFLVLAACKNKPSSDKEKTEQTAEENTPKGIDFTQDSSKTLQKWVAYHQDLDSAFSIKKFDSTDTRKWEKMKGTVLGNYEADFDPIYSDFLIFSPDKKQYLDLDSYHWQLDRDTQEKVLFSPDQEVNLVNIPDKTVERVAFRGPSSGVQDAYWKNDSVFVLLEGNDENTPFINVYNLKKEEIIHFEYTDTLAEKSLYHQERLKEKFRKNKASQNIDLNL